jgi:hypothetical protein
MQQKYKKMCKDFRKLSRQLSADEAHVLRINFSQSIKANPK